MKYESIADIYSASQRIREATKALAASISDEQATSRVDDEPWNVQEIFEHIAIVDGGATRIAAKLLDGARAADKASDGSYSHSTDFTEKMSQIAGMRVEAPDRVKPTGNVSIADSVAKLDEQVAAFDALRADLERLDISEPKFPHPFFGDLNAAEWLVVKNGHEARHCQQIQRVLDKIG